MSFLLNPYIYRDPLLVLEFLGDGTNGSTTFLDTSIYQRTVTPFGTAQISTAQSIKGGSSILLDGDSDNLQVTADSNLYIQAGEDFTVEAWVYLTDITPFNETIFSVVQNNSGALSSTVHCAFKAIRGTVGGVPSFVYFKEDLGLIEANGNSTVGLNTWTHLAAVRNSGSLIMYVNGSGGTPTSDNSAANIPADPVAKLGKNTDLDSQEWLPGYIDSFRFYKKAIYTGDFTP